MSFSICTDQMKVRVSICTALEKLWKNNLFTACSASVGSLESYAPNREEPIETTMHRQVYTFMQHQSVIGIVSISYVHACVRYVQTTIIIYLHCIITRYMNYPDHISNKWHGYCIE